MPEAVVIQNGKLLAIKLNDRFSKKIIAAQILQSGIIDDRAKNNMVKSKLKTGED